MLINRRYYNKKNKVKDKSIYKLIGRIVELNQQLEYFVGGVDMVERCANAIILHKASFKDAYKNLADYRRCDHEIMLKHVYRRLHMLPKSMINAIDDVYDDIYFALYESFYGSDYSNEEIKPILIDLIHRLEKMSDDETNILVDALSRLERLRP